VDRNRFKTIAFRLGDGSKSNYLNLAFDIEKKCKNIEYMCSDKYKACTYYKIAKHHIRGKSETCLVESFNSSMRDMLARLNRKTKRFSKSMEMLRLTLVMFFNKDISYEVYL
jgi:insertion element IS1 protein InsB